MPTNDRLWQSRLESVQLPRPVKPEQKPGPPQQQTRIQWEKPSYIDEFSRALQGMAKAIPPGAQTWKARELAEQIRQFDEEMKYRYAALSQQARLAQTGGGGLDIPLPTGVYEQFQAFVAGEYPELLWYEKQIEAMLDPLAPVPPGQDRETMIQGLMDEYNRLRQQAREHFNALYGHEYGYAFIDPFASDVPQQQYAHPAYDPVVRQAARQQQQQQQQQRLQQEHAPKPGILAPGGSLYEWLRAFREAGYRNPNLPSGW